MILNQTIVRCFLRKESGVGHYNSFVDHGMSPKNYLLHFELCPMSGYANFDRDGGSQPNLKKDCASSYTLFCQNVLPKYTYYSFVPLLSFL